MEGDSDTFRICSVAHSFCVFPPLHFLHPSSSLFPTPHPSPLLLPSHPFFSSLLPFSLFPTFLSLFLFLSLEGSILQAANEEKVLGVTVDNTLKFSEQCAEAVKKAKKMLGYIARNFEYKSKNVILPLYKSLVRPHLEYAVQLWSPYLVKDIAKIERIQKRELK